MIEDNKWTLLQPTGNPPQPRSGQCCTVIDDTLYMFGGLLDNEVANDFYCFKNNNWTKIKSEFKPSGRTSSQLCGNNQFYKLYLFGGTTHLAEKLCSNELFQYDILTNTWIILPSTTQQPSSRYGHSMTFNNSALFVFGGVKFNKVGTRMQTEFLNDLWVYSFIAKMWTLLQLRDAQQPQPRYRHSALFVNDNYYIIGGTTIQNRFGQIVKADLSEMNWNYLELEALKNKTKKNLFKGRFGHACLAIDNTIYIYGGNDDGLCDDALQLDIVKNQWQRKRFQGSIIPRDFFGFASDRHSLYIIGGRNQQGVKLNDIYQWNHNLKQDEYIYCTLQKEILNLLQQDICYNQVLTCNNAQQLIHSALIQQRCPQLFQYDLKQMDSILFKFIIRYIYSGQIDIKDLKQLKIIETLQWCVKLQDPNLLLYIILYILNEQYSQSDFDFALQELIKLDKNGNLIIKEIIEILKQRQNISKQKQQQQQEQITLFQKSYKLFIDLQTNMINKFYIDLKKLQNDKSTTDTKLIIGDKQFEVHSFILVARCEFFRALVKFEEGIIQKIYLDQIDANVMEIVIDYLYNGYKALQREQNHQFEYLVELYKASNYLMLNNRSFMYLLEESIAQYINMNNVFEMCAIGEQLNAQVLIQECSTYIIDNIKKFEQDQLQLLSKELMVRLLQQMGDKL